MNENKLIVLSVKSTKMQGVYMNETYDYDLYEVEARSTPFVTREINLIVDFLDKKFSGDMVACGSWDELEQDTILMILRQFQANQILRPIDFIEI